MLLNFTRKTSESKTRQQFLRWRSQSSSLSNRKLIVGYARVSTQKEAQQGSVKTQAAELEDCKCDLIVTEAQSAFRKQKTLAPRPGFEFVRWLVKQGFVKQLVVCNPTRLARNSRYGTEVLEELEDAEVHLYISDRRRRYNLENPEDKADLVRAIAAAEYASGDQSVMVKRGIERKRRNQEPLGVCFGYKIAEGKLVFDGDRADIAREIIEYFCTTRSIRKTVWHIRNKYQPNDVSFSETGLALWLQNPQIQGHTVYGRKTQSNWKYRSSWQWKYSTHPSLASPTQGAIIDTIFGMRAGKGQNRLGSGNNLFSGIAFCNCCGYSVTPAYNNWQLKDGTKKTKVFYWCREFRRNYNCSNNQSISESDLLDLVIDWLILEREKLIDGAIALEQQETISQPNPEKMALIKRLERIKTDNEDGLFDEAIAQLELRISELNAEFLPKNNISQELRQILIDNCDRQFFVTRDRNTLKEIFLLLIERIEIDQKEVKEIVLKF